MKFSAMDFFSKCDQIRRKLWNWSNLLKKPLIENLTPWYNNTYGFNISKPYKVDCKTT